MEYHISLGIKKIIIYDNNDLNDENFSDILQDYMKNNYVEIIDIRGMTSIQIPVYNQCYQKYKYLYDWFGFIDIDEYIYIKNTKNINNYFYHERFTKCELMYNDNNLINYDNRTLNDRFTTPKTFFYQGKSFVRGGLKNLLISTTHIPGINIQYFCNSNGERIYPKNFFGIKFEKKPKAFIKHYYTKTIEEFCNKIIKGHASYSKNTQNISNLLNI